MINQSTLKTNGHWHILILVLAVLFMSSAQAVTSLADKPLFSSINVPGNVALALSVEFPTALGSAYTDSYSESKEYLGYFDANKCYTYNASDLLSARHYFDPAGAASGHVCSNQWSGNFLNWALTQTIDPFRLALTGGYRSVDEVNFTLLEKAWASGQGGTVVDKSISGTTVSGATPYSGWSSFNLRINGQGNSFVFSKNSVGSPAFSNVYPEVPATGANGSLIYRMYARVQACKSAALKEDNCTTYPNGGLKPTGLIQKNALKLNFAAFGYLNDPGQSPVTVNDDRNRRIDGGVLRAKMAPLGPMKPVPGAPDVLNEKPEWDANTGIFLINPDVVSATASGVVNSGVINYLNKFGQTSKSYKKYDPVSELYYTAIRYFKNQGNVPAYTSMSEYSLVEKVVLIDGFPVITTWDDPIKYSCQANFIIGIGDTNTHVDGNLPGSTTPGIPSAAMPSEVANDTTVNAKTATNRVGALQGIGTIGSSYYTGTNNTRLIAGLAFDSHTVDMRPDVVDKQTVSTYWLDVLESGFVANNQYVLATKFGGFDVPVGFDAYGGPTTALPATQWDKNGDGDPDNYFRANNPALMITNLNKAFDDILKKTNGSSSAFAVANPNLSLGDASFSSSYTVEGWTGNVSANTLTFIAGQAAPVQTPLWSAVDRLESQTAGTGWNSNRFIATANCTLAGLGTQTCTGVPFRVANITSNLLALGVNAASQQRMLDFLRGDRSNAGLLGTKEFRDRSKILGDIVNSKVVAVGPPEALYSETYNPGYTSFSSGKSTRATVAYVGANDGMLHAFNGSNGNELFAYVPSATFYGPNLTPATDGLAALSKISYVHHYYVDATPTVTDVNFGGGANDWHSLLVGGLGKGGRSFYALDVTNPSSLANEASVAAAVKWEFTHTLMGYSYMKPLIVKTAKYGWVVILTSGYNNLDGKGYFFIVRPSDGTLLETVPLGTQDTGNIINETGLAQATAFINDYRDFTADAVYAGDLLGNLWRLDLTATGAAPYPQPTKIARLVTSAGVAQPVTTAPIVEIDQSTSKRFVFVGTGKLLSDSDMSSTQPQTFYAINDGTTSAFYNAATLPTGVDFPIKRADLVDITNNAAGVGSSVPANKVGYYIELGVGSNGSAYRVSSEMTSGAGILAFAANSTSGDVCSPSGSSKLFGLAYGTGKSVLSSAPGVPAAYIPVNDLITDLTLFKNPESNDINLGFGKAGGGGGTIGTEPTSVNGFTQLNWREIPE